MIHVVRRLFFKKKVPFADTFPIVIHIIRLPLYIMTATFSTQLSLTGTETVLEFLAGALNTLSGSVCANLVCTLKSDLQGTPRRGGAD